MTATTSVRDGQRRVPAIVLGLNAALLVVQVAGASGAAEPRRVGE